jgi:hypothetical protein
VKSNNEKFFRGEEILWYRPRRLSLGACICEKDDAYDCFADKVEIDNKYDREEVEASGGPCACQCHEMGEEREWTTRVVDSGPIKVDGKRLLRDMKLI